MFPLVFDPPMRLSSRDSVESTMRLLDRASSCEISFATVMRRSSTKPGLALMASPIISADFRSPSALMMVLFFSSCALSTVYRARSDCCRATCFCSTAFSYSGLKLRWVIATSSNRMLKSLARSTSRCRIMRLTSSRCKMSWLALYCATTLFRTSFTMEGKTLSSNSVPSDRYMSCNFAGLGRQRARREILTICRSRLPVSEVIVWGLALTSNLIGRSNHGSRKCTPSL
mmetsp:Transcript_51797/g.160668  ORF Transcript_51797/g.160668 Transcript_51797/m.160668 type:complete len:229 (-) Transcript_51797:248-934(-)